MNEQTLEDSNLSDQHSEEEETIGLQSIHQYEEGSVIEELQSNENDSILSSHISSSKEKNLSDVEETVGLQSSIQGLVGTMVRELNSSDNVIIPITDDTPLIHPHY